MKKQEACFADNGSSCGILQKLVCRKGKCPFYKTKNQRQKEIAERERRLRNLSMSKQQHISRLYYKKRYPWRKGAVI